MDDGQAAAIGIAWWRIVMLRRTHAERLITMTIGLAMALLYALYNEGTIAAFALFILAAVIGYAVAPRLSQRSWFARLTVVDTADKPSAACRTGTYGDS